MPSPTVRQPDPAHHLQHVGWAAPVRWLRAGWRDMWRCGVVSLAHGAALALFGATLTWWGWEHFWFLAGTYSGFLVIAPLLATSLYALSRALERGEPAGWHLVPQTWLHWRSQNRDPVTYWRLVRFGLLLGLAATGWVLTSAALITLLAPAPITGPSAFVRHILLASDNHVLELWLMMGGALAAPMFASSVIAIPLLLDCQVSVWQAVLTSWDAVLENPGPMLLWAGCLLLLTALGFATALLGLVLVVPWLGHASWHAYRDLVQAAEPR